ncbi:MAG: hypothetical protein ACRD2B_16000, partial [Terriglobia bacterium]
HRKPPKRVYSGELPGFTRCGTMLSEAYHSERSKESRYLCSIKGDVYPSTAAQASYTLLC